MRRIAMLLLVVGGLVGASCDALEPRWTAGYPADGRTCAEVCEDIGALCLESSCDGATIGVDEDLDGLADTPIPSTCDEPVDEVAGIAFTACCCGGG